MDSSDADENSKTSLEVVQRTLELAQQICVRRGSLAECHLTIAESIAQSINECLIDYALLVRCTVPQVKAKRSSHIVQPLGESTPNAESSTQNPAKDVNDDEAPEKSDKIKKPKKAKKKSKIKPNTLLPLAEMAQSPFLNNPDGDLSIPKERSPQPGRSTPADASMAGIMKKEFQDTDEELGSSGFQTPKSTAHHSAAQDSSSEDVDSMIANASNGSREQFYTPQEGSSNSSRRSSPPTTPGTKRPQKARSILRAEMLSEEIALQEETSEWQKTPENYRANAISSVADILSRTAFANRPNSSEVDGTHNDAVAREEKDPFLERPVRIDSLSFRQEASINVLEHKTPEDSEKWKIPIRSVSHDGRLDFFGRSLRCSLSGARQGILTRDAVDIEQNQAREAHASSKSPGDKNSRDDKRFKLSPIKRGRNYTGRQGSRHRTLEHKDRPDKIPYLGGGPQGVAWAYHSTSAADRILREAFIFLWEKPKTYFQPLPLRATEVDGKLEMAPAVISPSSVDNSKEPKISWDGTTVQITAHYPPWPDMRSNPAHPDFLPLFKLAEYQACEVAGYRIWRHDRELLPCALRDCSAVCSDFNPETRCCSGCGPKSMVRYCSFEHEIEDIENHWKICGMPRLVLKRIIDHATAPGNLDNVCPAIREMNGTRSFALHRQRHHASHAGGHYVLFHPTSGVPTVLKWPRTDQNWQDMDARIERLLNVVFLDGQRMKVLRYLYSLLRYMISISSINSQEPLTILKSQFASEFGSAVFRTTNQDDIFPCECQWYDGRHFAKSHLRSCRWSPWNKPAGVSIWRDETNEGIQKEVSDLENRYWILRAWAQQHPTVQNWKKRAEGAGFEEDFANSEIRFGPGFVGWGARLDNICG